MTETDIKKQIILLRDSSEEAFKCLFDHFQEGIYWYCLKILRDDDLAEDMLQEVFFRLWTNRAAIDEHRSLKSYLYTTAHNLSLNAIRDRNLANEKLRALNQSQISSNDPLMAVENMELRDHLAGAIEKLPDKCRIVFQLSRRDGLSHKEISAKLGIGLKTIETHIGNALKRIRKSLKDSGFEWE